MPFVGPWADMVDVAYSKTIGNHVKFMGEVVKAIPDMDDSEKLRTAQKSEGKPKFEPITGEPLRVLRHLLDKLDPKQHYGGLQKVHTPFGHFVIPYLRIA